MQFNSFTEIETSQNVNLISLDCSNNSIDNLDLSSNPSLFFLNCSNNLLEELNFQTGTNANVEFFNAGGNPNLNCIQIDDDSATYLRDDWLKDENTVFSENCLLSIQDQFVTQYLLYPNPVQNLLNIKGIDSIKNINIYTLSGNSVLEINKNFSTIPMGALASGVYIISIENDQGVINQKLIKE